MVTLRHAFDANSMKGLVLKILRGNYPAIPSTYSDDLKGIIAEMLIKELSLDFSGFIKGRASEKTKHEENSGEAILIQQNLQVAHHDNCAQRVLKHLCDKPS